MKIRLFVMLLFFVLTVPAFAWGEEITCKLSTNKLEVGLNPSKDSLSISGLAPEDAPVIITLEGPQISEQVSFGNNDSWFIKYAENEVKGLSGYYQVLTSEPLEAIEKSYHAELGLSPDFDHLNAKAWVRARLIDQNEPTLRLEKDYIKQAIQQKVAKNLYGIREGIVKRQGKHFQANIALVPNMPLGEIKVTAVTIIGDHCYKSKTQNLRIMSSSPLSVGFQELAVNPVVVMTLFMMPILMMTVGQILEIVQERKRLRQLKSIWR